MVASGAPVPRSDHAEAIAELARRIRDHVANEDFDGHRLRLRIGINSGAVVGGIIRTHKFSSTCGETPSTWPAGWSRVGYLGRSKPHHATRPAQPRYVFESTGHIEVKGKGQMETFILHRASWGSLWEFLCG